MKHNGLVLGSSNWTDRGQRNEGWGLAAVPNHKDNGKVRDLGRLLPIRLDRPKQWTREWMVGWRSDTDKTTRRRMQHRDGLLLYFANRAT